MLWRKSYYGMLVMVPLASALVILLLTGACAPVGQITEPPGRVSGVTMKLLFRSDTGCQVFYFYDADREADCWLAACKGTALDCEPAGRGDP